MLTTKIFADVAIGSGYGYAAILAVWWMSNKLTRKIT
jgi:hypothetical protein